jgi:type I restriction enzyme S subunit
VYFDLPNQERIKIVDYLDCKVKRIDGVINNCQKQISLLQERKQIIINDVVTGKVKVV